MARTKKSQSPEAPKPDFKVDLEIGGKHFTAEGTSIIEALKQLQPDNFKTRGKFIITHGDKQSMKLLVAPLVRKLMVNDIHRQVFEKNALATLK